MVNDEHFAFAYLYQYAGRLTLGDSQISGVVIQGGKRRVVCHGARHRAADGLYERGTSAVGQAREKMSPKRGGCWRSRRYLTGGAGGGGESRRHGPPDAAGLGDKVQRTGARGLISKPSPGAPGKLSAEHKAFLAHIVEAGPIPAIDGVVRWRACDLIMQLHEKFAISVSDDTVYRALKEL